MAAHSRTRLACLPYGPLMNTSDFLAAALRNRVNEAIAGEYSAGVAGCVDRFRRPRTDRLNVADGRDAGRYGIGGLRTFSISIPDTSWQARTRERQAAGQPCSARG